MRHVDAPGIGQPRTRLHRAPARGGRAHRRRGAWCSQCPSRAFARGPADRLLRPGRRGGREPPRPAVAHPGPAARPQPAPEPTRLASSGFTPRALRVPRFVDLPLSTPRLQLRPLRPADAEALFSIDADPLAIEPRNERSAKSLERLGCLREGQPARALGRCRRGVGRRAVRAARPRLALGSVRRSKVRAEPPRRYRPSAPSSSVQKLRGLRPLSPRPRSSPIAWAFRSSPSMRHEAASPWRTGSTSTGGPLALGFGAVPAPRPSAHGPYTATRP
jgi:hypothetical protein